MNIELRLTLDDAVAEVLGMLTGLDLTYEAEFDRYRAITRQLNRALRANALEAEWSYYASTLEIGKASLGMRELQLPSNVRPRMTADDAVRLLDEDRTVKWAYFLPRASLSKYEWQQGLWCACTRQSLLFSRPLTAAEEGLVIQIPVMREPRMFRLPESGEEVPDTIRQQLIDFNYPDVVTARAAFFYAQTDPVMQPRVPTLESGYKDVMYQVIEQDTRMSDTPYSNSFTLPVESGLVPENTMHRHPHADF
jgi:hypothetical protein